VSDSLHAREESVVGARVSVILDRKGTQVETVPPDATLGVAADRLTERGIGALVVVDGDGRLVGVISERDLVGELSRHGPGLVDLPVSAVMSRQVETCRLDTRTHELMAVMTERRFRHVPVVDDDNRPIGIVSIGDVVKLRLDELATEASHLETYVTGGSY
jgi:CBS domain-containing protein